MAELVASHTMRSGAVWDASGAVGVLLVVPVYREEHNGEEVILIGARQASGDDSLSDVNDVPRLTDRQLADTVRFRAVSPRKRAVSDILANPMEAELKANRRSH